MIRTVNSMKAPAVATAKKTLTATRLKPKTSARKTASESPVTSSKSSEPRPCRFAALDFETADYGRDSACALSVVVVEDHQIVHTWTSLIRPPRKNFIFTYLHGISWNDVQDKPAFKDLWPEITARLEGVDFIAAHNASFDRSVLGACCAATAAAPLTKPFVCTVKVARALWDLRPTTLADVCRHLKIPLKHHDAASDAHACARIMLAARQHGHEYHALLKNHALKAARK